MPIAFARSAGSLKSVISSDSATAETSAPPRPWIARDPTSIPWVVERPHITDATVNATMPIRNILRCPKMSPRRPPRSRKPPNVSR
ncbi:MAG TPA: hypothetical protein VL422_10720 [Miltoncostaea sp.]|nr:hypothetical protein [Miltoncostaea sp.]